MSPAPSVLAYVFWHRPVAGVEPAEYEGALRAFHEALEEGRPDGFRRSLAFRVGGAPWLAGEGYEDWYLVEGSAALDPLDAAAVAAAAGPAHDGVARLAGEGAGGLYRLRAGEPSLDDADAAVWLGKPAGASYESFQQGLSAWSERSGCGLWGRQMVLGPTPEFCLRGPSPLDVPPELDPVPVRTARIWP